LIKLYIVLKIRFKKLMIKIKKKLKTKIFKIMKNVVLITKFIININMTKIL